MISINTSKHIVLAQTIITLTHIRNRANKNSR